MSCFKFLTLFIFFVFITHSSSYSVEDKVVAISQVKNQITASKDNAKNVKKKTTKKTKNKIVRNLPQKEKKSEGIKATNEQLTATYAISNKTINLKSPLCQYAEKNDVVSLKRALMASNYKEEEVNTICKNHESLLMLAVKNNNYLTAKLLIEKGADMNIENVAGVTILHVIARTDSKEADRIIDLMIRHKNLNINAKDLEGYTPLMRAVEFEKITTIKQLVNMQADIDVKNNYGLNVMDLAKMSLEGKKTDEGREISRNIIKILEK